MSAERLAVGDLIRGSVRTAHPVIDRLTLVSAAVFVIVLAAAAYWDPSIRVLHVFESLLYVAAATLCVRHARFGYALGVASGIFWLWLAGRGSTFILNGFQVMAMSLRAGHIVRPDILIAVPGAVAMAGLVACSLAGYARLPGNSWRDVGLFALAMVIVTAFFVAIFESFAPQFLVPLRHMFAV
jgi:hypothetical protein